MPKYIRKQVFKKLITPLALVQMTPSELQTAVTDAFMQSLTSTAEAVIIAEATATVARSEEYITLSRVYLASQDKEVAIQLTDMVQAELKSLMLDESMEAALLVWKHL